MNIQFLSWSFFTLSHWTYYTCSSWAVCSTLDSNALQFSRRISFSVLSFSFSSISFWSCLIFARLTLDGKLKSPTDKLSLLKTNSFILKTKLCKADRDQISKLNYLRLFIPQCILKLILETNLKPLPSWTLKNILMQTRFYNWSHPSETMSPPLKENIFQLPHSNIDFSKYSKSILSRYLPIPPLHHPPFHLTV